VSFKAFVWRLLGKSGEPVVVSFLSGPEPLARAMLDEVRQLVPDREHFVVTNLNIEGVERVRPDALPGPLRGRRIGLAPVLFTGEPEYRPLRRTAFRMAPHKVLAYNIRLERHHLRLRTAIASMLFLRGVPVDRIYLRPTWLFPLKRDRTRKPDRHEVFEGRPLREGYPRAAILSPYFPYPLSHGGAVRIFNLIREASATVDVLLFTFAEKPVGAIAGPVLDHCARVIVFPNPRYREPRWASLQPPEVNEYESAYVAQIVADFRKKYDLRMLQVEYTMLASYGGEVLVEHDVTFDLYDQVFRRTRSLTAWWDLWRWRRYETAAVRRYGQVVAMSDKDAGLLADANVRVIPNGVDLDRFRPEPESSGARLLFVGSFRHFPNVLAYRWFVHEVWPLLAQRWTDLSLTVIAGPDPHLYCPDPPRDARIDLRGFIADVRPFYAASNVVIVPTQVSAGTNLKVLEGMACERAIVSTPSGCAGLGLEHGESVCIAETPAEFAAAITSLLADFALRASIARAGRRHAVRHYGWPHIGLLQKRLWLEVLAGVRIRNATRGDLPAIAAVQRQSHSASHWEPDSYFDYDVRVAERDGEVRGFMVTRHIEQETEVLNLAVDLASRRTGVATALLASLDTAEVFLEVRESNTAARNLYSKLGFYPVGRREKYYDDPVESAVVMRLSRPLESDKF
jgi:ribosomal protein S18 acetylase RimI-like enzyme